jgi:hypothetical protein
MQPLVKLGLTCDSSGARAFAPRWLVGVYAPAAVAAAMSLSLGCLMMAAHAKQNDRAQLRALLL